MVGIILAGGSGTRLFPITKGLSKQLLPIYDKPMIYYPLSTLMLANIRKVLLISTPTDLPMFQRLLGDGSDLGMSISYAEQPSPDGIAQAFIIGEKFIGDDNVCLILGDNIFYGGGLTEMLKKIAERTNDNPLATVFGVKVKDPQRYGVAEFSKDGQCISIEEKPTNPKSNYAVPGIYFYPNDVIDIAKRIKPSKRGELEITSVNQVYLDEGRLFVEKFPRGFSWFDTGTFESLLESSNFVEAVEKRNDIIIGCLEEIAYNNGWISKEQLETLAKPMIKNTYGKYLLNLIRE